jgi:hypothetical protein
VRKRLKRRASAANRFIVGDGTPPSKVKYWQKPQSSSPPWSREVSFEDEGRERGGSAIWQCRPVFHGDLAQRKPMWLVPVSEGVPRRALGR